MKFLPVIIVSVYCLVWPLAGEATTTTQLSLTSLLQCTGTDCSLCNVVHLGNGLIKWLIGFLCLLFAVLIAWAGFELVTSGGNQRALDSAKDKLTSAIIGLIIVLAAWLIVDTIMRGLIGTEGREGQVQNVTGWLYWSTVQCQEQITPGNEDYVPEDVEIVGGGGDDVVIGGGGGGIPNPPYFPPTAPGGTSLPRTKETCDGRDMVGIKLFGLRDDVIVHPGVVSSLQAIDAEWRALGGQSYYRIVAAGGFRGGCGSSWHEYGLAIDINPDTNPHCPDRHGRWYNLCRGQNRLVTDMHRVPPGKPPFFDLFLRRGWSWGGGWCSSKDAMHFSTGEPQNCLTQSLNLLSN